jgi:hypothetical protein
MHEFVKYTIPFQLLPLRASSGAAPPSNSLEQQPRPPRHLRMEIFIHVNLFWQTYVRGFNDDERNNAFKDVPIIFMMSVSTHICMYSAYTWNAYLYRFEYNDHM